MNRITTRRARVRLGEREMAFVEGRRQFRPHVLWRTIIPAMFYMSPTLTAAYSAGWHEERKRWLHRGRRAAPPEQMEMPL